MSKSKYYYIYKTTNLINGRFYIGKHETFWKNNYYLGSGKILKQAFEIYGKENFKKEIIEYCTKETINEKEIYWIKHFNATEPKVGYNITDGGTGGAINKGKQRSKDANRKASITRKLQGNTKAHLEAKKNPEYIKRQSEASLKMWSDPDFKRKRVENQKEGYRIGRIVPGMLGKKFSEESRLKLSLVRLQKVLVVDLVENTSIIYESHKEANQKLGVKVGYYIKTGNPYKKRYLIKKIEK